MPDLTTEIFHRIYVCRAFRLSGLHQILQRFPTTPHLDPSMLPWKLGELTSIYREKEYYIVSPERAKTFRLESPEPSYCTLHDAWRDWYRSEFGKHHRYEDLVELLYHEAAYLKRCTSVTEPVTETLQKNIQEYLWEYCRSFESLFNLTFTLPFPHLKKAFVQLTIYLQQNGREEQSNDVSSYLENLIDWITKLNRWEEILSSSEYATFNTFLNTLSI